MGTNESREGAAEGSGGQGPVALVTGGTRGVGRGVVEALVETGAIVYYTGRTAAEDAAGAGVGIRCDHTDDAATAAVFARVEEAEGRLDVLVNCAWGGYERMMENGVFTWNDPFWEQPVWRWGAMFEAGVRAAFVASQHAARLMIPAASGLIVNLSYWSARKRLGNALYGMAKAATDKLTADAADELADHGVTVVSLYPGLVRTERVMEFADHLDLSGSESPRFTGRAVAALLADSAVDRLAGRPLVVAELARRYGFTDVDGRTPDPLTLETA